MTPPVVCVGPRPIEKRRLLAPFMLVLALTAAGMAPDAHANVSGEFMSSNVVIASAHGPTSAPSVALGTWTSKPGESREDFVKRLAVPMHDYTAQTRFEACGILAHNMKTDQWRVQVTTNHSHMGCIEVLFDDPDFIPQPLSIHTHPKGGGVTPNAQDVAMFPQRGMRVGYGRMSLDSEDFSQIDYTGGAGYVVLPGAGLFGSPSVLYQDGTGPASRQDLGGLPQVSKNDRHPDQNSHWLASAVQTFDRTVPSAARPDQTGAQASAVTVTLRSPSPPSSRP